MLDRLTMSVEDVAKELGVSRDTAYKLCRKDDCPFSFRIGNRILISRDKLAEWIFKQVDESKA